jgi:poly(A) polymerase
MLRAFRLAAQLGLEMDSATLQAINIQAPALTRSAPERIRYEWMLLLSQPEGFISILGMEETGLLGIIFPELVPLKGVMQGRFHHLDVFQHSLLTVKLLEQITQEKIPLPADLRREVISYLQQKGKLAYLKWAALMHDLGKATTAREKDGHQTFYGHAEESQRQFDPLADRLKLSNLEKIFFQKLLGGHMRPFSLAQEKGRGTLTGRALKRFVRDTAEEVNGFFLLALADSLAAQGTEKPPDFEERLLEVWRRALQIKEEWFPVRTPRPPLITGKDLIDLGLKPGPLFKVLLSEIQEEHWEGKVRSKEEALSWVKKRIGSG